LRFVIVGVGGTGGWLAMGLAATIEWTPSIDPKVLILVDGDNFEPKNQSRQHFMAMGNKAQVRAAELQPMYPSTFIVPDERWVVDNKPDEEIENTKVVEARELLKEDDLYVVFTAVDNFKTRADIVAAAAEKDNIDLFLVGNDDEYFGSVYHYRRRDGADITANPLEFKPELFDPEDRNPGLMSCQERAAVDGGTQFIWTNMAVAAWAGAKLNEVIVRQTTDSKAWDECMFDLRDGTAQPYFRKIEAETPELAEAVGVSAS
jgi:molybdopterin/thiamine biosynthesis adenylyltransferase